MRQLSTSPVLSMALGALLAGAGILQAQTPPPASPAPLQDVEASCKRLKDLKLPGLKSIATHRELSGHFYMEAEHRDLTGLPSFCRVQARLEPTSQSVILIELWLPEDRWNGRFLGTGNGGSAGHIQYGALGSGLKHGFAPANTDMGTAPDANRILDAPPKWADFGYRATHEMTVAGKAIVSAYYSSAASHSYFTGCSTGGQQALQEAERFPGDYDGILAGAPANNRTGLHSSILWNLRATERQGDKSFLPKDTAAFVQQAVIAACAGKDGGAPTDNFLTDPRACKFDPKTLPLCSQGTNVGPAPPFCVTAPQLAALQMIYLGATDPVTGEHIYAPLPFGTEAAATGIAHKDGDALGIDNAYFYPLRWALQAGFDPIRFDFDKDEDKLVRVLAPDVNANNPDLTSFQKRGGKLLMYGGTADPTVPYPDAVNFYDRVVDFELKQSSASSSSVALATTQHFFRYFLVPGLSHCGGGPGLSIVNEPLDPLERWVEDHQPPAVLSTAGNNHMQRNACPYPAFPEYTSGDPAKASSFQCVTHPRGEVVVPAPRFLK